MKMSSNQWTLPDAEWELACRLLPRTANGRERGNVIRKTDQSITIEWLRYSTSGNIYRKRDPVHVGTCTVYRNTILTVCNVIGYDTLVFENGIFNCYPGINVLTSILSSPEYYISREFEVRIDSCESYQALLGVEHEFETAMIVNVIKGNVYVDREAVSYIRERISERRDALHVYGDIISMGHDELI